jgi:hypothetical protein
LGHTVFWSKVYVAQTAWNFPTASDTQMPALQAGTTMLSSLALVFSQG